MSKQKKILVANWKMNPPSAAQARVLFAQIKRAGSRLERVETIICPPTSYLGLFVNAGTSRVRLGAQNVFWSNTGRATGEVSPEMLRDLGVSYTLVGHSERRAFGETDEIVSRKALAALKEGIKVILCIGEKERDEYARFYELLKQQIKCSLAGITKRFFFDLLIAYEPVWAIGKNAREAMSPRDIRETSIFIRKTLTDLYDAETALIPPILYGGSVEESNTASVLAEGGVSGLLVGHKSLDAEAFGEILKAANAV